MKFLPFLFVCDQILKDLPIHPISQFRWGFLSENYHSFSLAGSPDPENPIFQSEKLDFRGLEIAKNSQNKRGFVLFYLYPPMFF